MNALQDWAQRWAIPAAALQDLQAALLGLEGALPAADAPPRSEAAVQAATRVRASQLHMRVWRNNVGAFHDPERRTFVRYGLANDSKQVNEVLKSADLIGIRPRVIQPGDVGTVIGQFLSLEIKEGGWKWRGDAHEIAQRNWQTLVQSLGGDARFISDERQL